jgi:ATP-dependent Clp protease ATP-binding subunit ClpB
MLKIVDLRLDEIEQRLADRKIVLDIDKDSREHLALIGYSPVYGARPLNRVIQSELLNPLSVMLLSDRICDEETVQVRFDASRNRLQIIPNHEGTAEVEQMDVDDDDIEIEEIE